jgi:PST family polysaccharide transporter
MSQGLPTVPDERIAPSQVTRHHHRSSYAQILKSSAVLGGSSLIAVLLGVIRVKCTALLLGPAGVGLMGALSALVDVARNMAEFGVSRSGVRQIAQSVGSQDEQRIARTFVVLRRTMFALGVLGGAVLALCAGFLSRLTFETSDHATEIAWLSLAVLFGVLTLGQTALLQGMRKIAEQAKSAVAGAALGTLATVIIVYALGRDGIVPAIVATAALGFLAAAWYARGIRVAPLATGVGKVRAEAASLLKLGLSFMISGLLMAGAGYAVRLLVIRLDGIEAAGLYQAAWTLGGLYLGFILQAMGTDYYPRLVSKVDDHASCNRMVNEQAQVGMLLAAPGILATLVLAPALLQTFYSTSFASAADALRWMCLGMAMRVVTWPLGFVIVAKNLQAAFILIDLIWATVNVALSWWLIRRFGVEGAGLAWFLAYVLHAAVVYPFVRRITGFSWSRECLREIVVLVASSGMVFHALRVMPSVAAIVLGLVVLAICTIRALRQLAAFVDRDMVPRSLVRLVDTLRPAHR